MMKTYFIVKVEIHTNSIITDIGDSFLIIMIYFVVIVLYFMKSFIFLREMG